MKNMKKKGFTLVELLVVIAILAILATVSVIGYTAFVDKADDSKAVTELTQVKTLVKGALMVDSETVDVSNSKKVTITLTDSGLTFKYDPEDGEVSETHKTEALRKLVEADVDFETKLAVDGSGNVTYTDGDATAKWTVSTDKVDAT